MLLLLYCCMFLIENDIKEEFFTFGTKLFLFMKLLNAGESAGLDDVSLELMPAVWFPKSFMESLTTS